MIRKNLVLAAIVTVMMTMTGCGNVSNFMTALESVTETVETTPEASPEATSEATPEPTLEPISEATPEPTSEAISEATPEPTPKATSELPTAATSEPANEPLVGGTSGSIVEGEDEESGIDSIIQIFTESSNTSDEEMQKLFSEVNKTTGYICDSADNLTKMLESVGISVEELYEKMNEESERTLYHFTMYNQETAGAMGSGDSITYLTCLVHDNMYYYVLLGSEDADAAEVENFTQKGTTLEYWAIATEEDGNYMVVPIFAGNDENGYYVVRPTLISSGIDMSGTMSLVELGIDFTTKMGANTNNGEVNVSDEEKLYFEITGIEPSEGLQAIHYELTNPYAVDLYLTEETILLNGVDITDSTVAFFYVDANDTIEDYFYIYDYDLAEGDELVIQGMLTDFGTMDEMGSVEFKLVMERLEN
ncbi:MAG: hypothetical protein IJF07_00135 [Lachnospiraceae bacterium]|nr:hypothetical protein [Lachnospiraceae bacterium]